MQLESAKILEEKGVEYRVIKLSNKAISAEDVVKYAQDKIGPDEVCKTIVVKDKKENKYAFFLKGSHRIDFSKTKEIIGQRTRIVNDNDLKEITGRERGEVCPILLDIPIFVDKRVFQTEKINFGSGNLFYGIEITSKDLEKAIDFKIVDVIQF